MSNVQLDTDQSVVRGGRMEVASRATVPTAKRRLGFWCGLGAITAVTLVIAGCNSPHITRFSVAGPNSGPVRTGSAVDFSADIKFNGANVRPPGPVLNLTPLRPAGTFTSRPLTPQPTTGNVTTHTATVPPTDTAVVFVQGSRWRATAFLDYVYGWSYATEAQSQVFNVLEPANTFGFVDTSASTTSVSTDSSPLEGWHISSYHKFQPPFGPETALTRRPTLLAFAAQNYPQAQAGDNAIGFNCDLSSVPNGDVNRDNWSAIISSPGGLHWSRFQVQVRTDALSSSLQMLAYVEVTDSSGVTRNVSLKAGTDNHYWSDQVSLDATDVWKIYYFDTTNSGVAAGGIGSINLEVFGPISGLGAAQGKHVLIDQVSGQ